MSRPLFSVVIPVYNRTEALERAVRSCLLQSWLDYEVIVVDDGSDEPIASSLESVEDPRVRCIRVEPNAGVSNARNVGMQQASGQYVAFLDSDDEFTPDKLAVCAREIEAQGFPHDLCLGSRIYICREGGHRAAIPSHLIEPGEDVYRYLFVRGGILSTDTLVVSRDLACQTQFRVDLTRHEDYDFMGRLAQAGAQFHMLPDALAIWHDDVDQGRLTQSTGFRQSRYWFDSVADSMAVDVRAACQLRILGPMAARENRFAGLPIFARNLAAANTMSLPARVLCLLKCSAPYLYTRLTSLYVNAKSLRAGS